MRWHKGPWILLGLSLGAVLLVGTSKTPAVHASDCTKTAMGFTPLSDFGTQTYKGFRGGLYPGGQSRPPEGHAALAMARAAALQPLGVDGRPQGTGRIVLLSVGMSNATQEFSAFSNLVRADTEVSPEVLTVDGAQGGQTASVIRDPNANYWTVLDQRLTQAHSSPAQVQVIWLKEANARPTDAFPKHVEALQADLKAIVLVAAARFPNLKLVYLSSRTYGGYASTELNPEPYAYESGFAVKWLLEAQMAGDASLNADPAKGKVNAPVLLWGPYLWADGLKPRADGLFYRCEDFGPDGTHPSDPIGRRKVANLLLSFFKSDPTTRGWFLADPGVPLRPTPTEAPRGTPTPGPGVTATVPPTALPSATSRPTGTPTAPSTPTRSPSAVPTQSGTFGKSFLPS